MHTPEAAGLPDRLKKLHCDRFETSPLRNGAAPEGTRFENGPLRKCLIGANKFFGDAISIDWCQIDCPVRLRIYRARVAEVDQHFA